MQNVLQLEPEHELRFRGPFREPTQTTMRLTNTSDNCIAFKVKTTAPKKYCVRPTCGDLKPRSCIDIQVILQPLHYDPNDQQRHKFLVQSLIVADPLNINHETIWRNADPEQIMEAKLRCVLEASEDTDSKTSQTPPWGEPQRKLAEGPADQRQQQQQQQQQQPPQKIDTGLNAELRRLRDENLSLRRQNVALREDGQRGRSSGGSIVSDTQSGNTQTFMESPPDPFADASTTSIVVMSLILMAVGYLIAKTLF